MAEPLTVALGKRSYPVHVVRDGLAGLGAAVAEVTGAGRAVIVTDSHVQPLWSGPATRSLEDAGLSVSEYAIPAGESNKTVATWSRLVSWLLSVPVDRRTPVIALGGGVVGDVTGFAAATALRGVPFIQVPTTVLAMVDSSVGGKTAVNHEEGKNLIGAFYQPQLVYADLDTLSTLAADERRAGLAEVVKTAVLGDAGFFASLEQDAQRLSEGHPDALVPVVRRCVELKAAVVAQDEREAGLREVLNLGHTVAHGLERVLGYGTLRHGEAVAIGLVVEAEWAQRRGVCDGGVVSRLRALLTRLGLPTSLPDVDRDAVVAAMRLDKKARATFVRVPVPTRLGGTTRVQVALDELHELLG